MVNAHFIKLIGTAGLGIILATAASCSKQSGCTAPEAENFDVDAEDNDGSCTYRYLQHVLLNDFDNIDENGHDWDFGSGPDPQLLLAPLASPTWDYRTEEFENQFSPICMVFDEEILLTNETWEFELNDADDPTQDDLITAGTFNPVADGQGGEILINLDGTELVILYTVK